MNKKAVSVPIDLIVGLISFAIVIGIVFIIFFNVGGFLGARTNQEAVSNWVRARSLADGIDAVITEVPPVPDLAPPIEIKKKEDLLWDGNKPPRAYKEIADSMVDCWSAFDRGTTDFINAVEKEVFCFPCRHIKFSDEIKREKVEVIGFNKYLNSTRISGPDSPTYLQYLTNDKTYVLKVEDLEGDVIVADRNLYIEMVATSGRGLLNIFLTVIGFGGDEEEVEAGTLVTQAGAPESPSPEGLLTGGEQAEIAFGAEAGVAGTRAYQTGKKYIPKLTDALRSSTTTAATTGVQAEVVGATTERLVQVPGQGLELVAEREAADLAIDVETKVAGRAATAAEERVAKEAAKKAVEKGMLRTLARGGVAIVGRLNLAVDVALIGYGVYELTFGDNPFAANIALVDPAKASEICNE